MIGLLFGELKRLNLGQRIFLVAAGVGIALFANFLRVLFLVTMASRAHDVSVVNKWHDLAGYGILLLVFIGTMLMAGSMGSRAGSMGQGARSWEQREEDHRLRTTGHEPKGAEQNAQFGYRQSASLLLAPCSLLFLWLVAIEIGVEAWYRMHERNTIATPAWLVRWPADAP